jgi:hypothetical protein
MSAELIAAFEKFWHAEQARLPAGADLVFKAFDKWGSWWSSQRRDEQERLRRIINQLTTADVDAFVHHLAAKFGGTSALDDTPRWVLTQLADAEPFVTAPAMRTYQSRHLTGPHAILLHRKDCGSAKDQYPIHVFLAPSEDAALHVTFYNLHPTETSLDELRHGLSFILSVKGQLAVTLRAPLVAWRSASFPWLGVTCALACLTTALLVGLFMRDAFEDRELERTLYAFVSSGIMLAICVSVWWYTTHVSTARRLQKTLTNRRVIVVAAGAHPAAPVETRGSSFQMALWVALLRRLYQDDSGTTIGQLVRWIPRDAWDAWAFTGAVDRWLRPSGTMRIEDKIQSCLDTEKVAQVAASRQAGTLRTYRVSHPTLADTADVAEADRARMAEAASELRRHVWVHGHAHVIDVLVHVATGYFTGHHVGRLAFMTIAGIVAACWGSAAWSAVPSSAPRITQSEVKSYPGKNGTELQLHLCVESASPAAFVIALYSKDYRNIEERMDRVITTDGCGVRTLLPRDPQRGEAARSADIELRILQPRRFLFRQLSDHVVLRATLGALERDREDRHGTQ